MPISRNTNFKRLASGEDGAIMVESTMVLPLILIFLIGMVNFGVMFDYKHQAQVIVQEGVMYGIRLAGLSDNETTNGPIYQLIYDRVQDLLALREMHGTIVCQYSGYDNGNLLSCALTVELQNGLPVEPFGKSSISVAASGIYLYDSKHGVGANPYGS